MQQHVSITSPHIGGGNQHGQTDSNSALTLHCGWLWFFMRIRLSFGRLRGDLQVVEKEAQVTSWWVGTNDLWVNGLALLTFDP